MGHDFKPVTIGESIQVAILDELQQIRSLLEPSEPAGAELPAEPEPEQVADAPAEVPAPAKKAAAKKTARKTVTGR
jgi:hypothetical protein